MRKAPTNFDARCRWRTKVLGVVEVDWAGVFGHAKGASAAVADPKISVAVSLHKTGLAITAVICQTIADLQSRRCLTWLRLRHEA